MNSVRTRPRKKNERGTVRKTAFGQEVNVSTGDTLFSPVSSKLERAIEKVVASEQEPKYLDTVAGYTNISAAGTINANLTSLAQGSGGIQRTGDQVRLRSIQLRVAGYQNNTTSVQEPNIVRVIVYRWMYNTAVSVPTPTDVLSQSSILSIGQSITSHYNVLNERRGVVQILHDSYHYTSLNANSFAFSWSLELDSEVAYNPSATSGIGHLYLLILSDDAGVVSPCPSVAYSSRVIFQDG